MLGFAIGIAVPILLMLAVRLIDHQPSLAGFDHPLYRLTSLVWPSSIWLLATKGIEDTLQGYAIVAISIIANALLYGGGLLSRGGSGSSS
jgi:hypothetical protein